MNREEHLEVATNLVHMFRRIQRSLLCGHANLIAEGGVPPVLDIYDGATDQGVGVRKTFEVHDAQLETAVLGQLDLAGLNAPELGHVRVVLGHVPHLHVVPAAQIDLHVRVREAAARALGEDADCLHEGDLEYGAHPALLALVPFLHRLLVEGAVIELIAYVDRALELRINLSLLLDRPGFLVLLVAVVLFLPTIFQLESALHEAKYRTRLKIPILLKVCLTKNVVIPQQRNTLERELLRLLCFQLAVNHVSVFRRNFMQRLAHPR
mmetsp:Transcript_34463/g.98663  ORF Transcript_34463/g.98663 Transcript_34463/m.98663 type:complete len:266 (-) Transcript_34463:149-946(-)